MTPEQADKNHNPCLIKIMEEKKLQYGLKHARTHKHTKQKDVTALLSMTHDSHRSWELRLAETLLERSNIFSRVTPMKDYSVRLHSTHFLGPDRSPTPCLAFYLHDFYQITSRSPSLVKPLATKMCYIPQKSAAP